MRRSFVSLALGLLMAAAAIAAPAMATEITPQLTAAVYSAPEKAMTSADSGLAAITAVQAQHATASASASRTSGAACASCFCCAAAAGPGGDPDYNSPAPVLALEVSHSYGIAVRDPGDEDDSKGNSDHDGKLAASIPGDNESSGDGDSELPLAA